ncbi:hypothetical protein T8K17_22535 [Thalassobaculum sp. OXR-137]|uniref:hypothetical protein n=1 Tax=Thalassobaculum sp. OXR-137 TaxID=3100173 RepID=UPI002AC89A34|nr:hypothetical protein [Thalassobaculum sp. OXR-137]WPZ34004.1 hypothetical protein T8K17_22535 [Thalassobaculum sp. OXR-137]
MAQAVEIAQKLKLTSIALGCLTRKELCSAFARVNPNTLMTLQNSYNWQSGRSIPRSFSIFEDWAAALGIDQGPHFVMSSSLGEFVRVLGEKFSLPADLLKSFGYDGPAAPSADLPPRDDGGSIWTGGGLLRGSFLAVSPSWSPSQRGRLVCGPLTIDVVNETLVASYQESVLGQTVPFSGTGTTDGRTCQLMLRCPATGDGFLMAFHLPPLPGNFAGGIFAGSAIYDPNSEPTASSIVLLRNHALSVDELATLSQYLAPEPDVMSDQLAKLGYAADADQVAEREILSLLLDERDEATITVRRERVTAVAVLLDRRRLETAA